jgi:hypothetical protein
VFQTTTNNPARSEAGLLLVLIAVTILSWPTDVANADVSLPFAGLSQGSDENLKVLGAAIDGNVFESGKRDSKSKYERYEYRAFRLDGCSLRWHETHEVYESGRKTLLEVQDVTVPLSVIRLGSVESNKITNSGHLVSFQTLRLKPGITAIVETTYEDGSENKSDAIQTGAGLYFSDSLVAQKVVKALIATIRSCSPKGA